MSYIRRRRRQRKPPLPRKPEHDRAAAPALPPSSAAMRTRLHAGFRALSVSGPVRRNPSPGCPMAPPRCVLNNKHPCNPKSVCYSISSAFLPRAAGGRIQKTCHMSVICQVYVQLSYLLYVRYIMIPGIYHFWEHDVYLTYTRHIPVI
jgi:hypothetical protein